MYRRFIDWTKTGCNLQLLRQDNLTLRKNSCRSRKFKAGECEGKCDECRFEMDNSISRAELALCFGVTEHVIYSWERGRTPVGIEDLLFYCDLAGVELKDILVFCP